MNERTSRTMGGVAPPRSVRFSDQDLDLLRRLQVRLRRTQREVLSMALLHLWETLERDQRVHLELSQRDDNGKPPSVA